MKKVTIIAFIITIVYCGLSTYVLFKVPLADESTLALWKSSFFIPGHFIGFVGSLFGGTILAILGQIITFFLLFYILKTTFNWMAFELQKKKN
ncbi:MAG: hypothetical protein ACPGVD_02575 [Flavobacteriales bacterium]